MLPSVRIVIAVIVLGIIANFLKYQLGDIDAITRQVEWNVGFSAARPQQSVHHFAGLLGAKMANSDQNDSSALDRQEEETSEQAGKWRLVGVLKEKTGSFAFMQGPMGDIRRVSEGEFFGNGYQVKAIFTKSIRYAVSPEEVTQLALYQSINGEEI